jgi:hypothetical protein
MKEIWEFIKYALKSALDIFAGILGGGSNASDNWVVDTFVGFITIVIIVLILFLMLKFTGLIRK